MHKQELHTSHSKPTGGQDIAVVGRKDDRDGHQMKDKTPRTVDDLMMMQSRQEDGLTLTSGHMESSFRRTFDSVSSA